VPRRASATRLVYVTVIPDPSGDTERADVEAASKLAQREEAGIPLVSQQARWKEERKK